MLKTIPYGAMTTLSRRLAFLLLLPLASAAQATDFAGNNVLIPIVGRTPGLLGTEWRTDLVVTNVSRNKPASTFIVLSTPDREDEVLQVDVGPLGTLHFKDVLQTLFRRATAAGTIRVASSSPEALISARARVYNVGGAHGEYGQIVQGMPVTSLALEAYLPGLSGVNGNRTNVGIANPGNSDAAVFISIYEQNGEGRGGFSTVIPARSVRQMNDIFGFFQTGPLDAATIRITSSHGVYPYASIVRSDSGDADFVTATGVQIDSSQIVVTPACATPAPLFLAPRAADGWIVFYNDGVDTAATTAALAAKYGFTPSSVWVDLRGFASELTQAMIAGLRCEPSVKFVEQNAYASIAE
ncbi:MAG: hypothetical protein AABO58_03515 [Acidobacteriota bacterium]